MAPAALPDCPICLWADLAPGHLHAGENAALGAAKAASAISTLTGLWLFVSPWVYGAAMNGNAWNNWIVGGFMVLFGFTQVARPADSRDLSWCNLILGLWTLISPWIYGYAATNTGRFLNSLCVGVIVFLFSITSAWVGPHRTAAPHR